MSEFTHLHLHSHFSLLDGACEPEKLVSRVKELGMTSVAMTDHGNIFGAMHFYNAAKSSGIRPIIGCELYRVDRTFGMSGRTGLRRVDGRPLRKGESRSG